jgi:hypothetical protein
VGGFAGAGRSAAQVEASGHPFDFFDWDPDQSRAQAGRANLARRNQIAHGPVAASQLVGCFDCGEESLLRGCSGHRHGSVDVGIFRDTKRKYPSPLTDATHLCRICYEIVRISKNI